MFAGNLSLLMVHETKYIHVDDAGRNSGISSPEFRARLFMTIHRLESCLELHGVLNLRRNHRPSSRRKMLSQ